MTKAVHAHIPGTTHAVSASGRTFCGWQTTLSKSWSVSNSEVSCAKCTNAKWSAEHNPPWWLR